MLQIAETLDSRQILRALRAVKRGDFSIRLPLDLTGIDGEIAMAFNDVVELNDQLARELKRMSVVVGKEGKVAQRAKLADASGSWETCIDTINSLIGDVVQPITEVARVIGGASRGDLSQTMTLDFDGRPLKGEFLRIGKIVNTMVDQLGSFASEVTRVAREVGTEGKLGGQARVPGAAGLWRDLTDNVNQLAANLTTQVRAIAEVATAVTKGDLTRSITVEASGEVASLKDNINEMIGNLADTTRKNNEQDWLKTNLAKFTRMLQGERDLATVTNLILSEIAPLVGASHGVFYLHKAKGDEQFLDLVASYASQPGKHLVKRVRLQEGLIGQCAYEQRPILLTHVPPDYIKVNSGLGEAPPLTIIVLPVLFEGEIKAVLELASFANFSATHRSFLDQLMESIGIVLNTIAANMRTERLLAQSQLLTAELQSQQEELKKTNEQLARTSKYKSEFLANMSHELRTPLNSLLVLSKILSDNVNRTLTAKEVQFAETIHMAGTELLALINDILDLSKIESGTVTLDVAELNFADLKNYFLRSFGPIANDKQLRFDIEIDPMLPPTMQTDCKRLQQVIKNLLSNAFKFTATGAINLVIAPATMGWSARNHILNAAPMVVALSVRDTGIGIASDKQRVIFEAFQQADGTTSRKYGGTGLGLSISRELTRLLGGEITVTSAPGEGSTFTLFVPATDAPAPGMNFTGLLARLPPENQILLSTVRQRDPSLAGRRVLIVDDDVRNVFSLASLLEQHKMEVLHAENGRDAIAILETMPAIDVVLMDVMMPEMDGYETMRSIRARERFRTLPVIAVTAKAMQEDREKCIAAGASDYAAKPVDIDQIISVLRVWLRKVPQESPSQC